MSGGRTSARSGGRDSTWRGHGHLSQVQVALGIDGKHMWGDQQPILAEVSVVSPARQELAIYRERR